MIGKKIYFIFNIHNNIDGIVEDVVIVKGNTMYLVSYKDPTDYNMRKSKLISPDKIIKVYESN